LPKWQLETVDGEEQLVETVEWRDFKSKRNDELALQQIGLSKSNFTSFDQYAGKDAPGNILKLRQYVERFDKTFKSVSLYLWSSRNGTQKSTTARVLCYELMKQKKTVQFVLMGNLLKNLTQENFAKDSEEGPITLIEKCRNVDFLVIDDSFDPMKATMYRSGYQLSFLDMFLRQRIEEHRKAICFTSNIAPDKIDDKVFGISLKALVIRSVPKPMEFNDGIDDFNPLNLWDD
jgi:DNA replication protein DnaC